MQPAMLAQVLIGLVAAAFCVQLVLQKPGAEPQPLSPRTRNRLRSLPALGLELAVRFPQPAASPGSADRFRVEIPNRLRDTLRRIVLTLGLLTSKLALEPLAPTGLGLKLRRQLVTARVAMLLVLGLVGRDRLRDDLPRDPVIVNIRVTTRARGQLRAIHRDHTRAHQPGPGAQSQHRTEQLVERPLVTTDKPGDRRVIRHHIASDHPVRNVLTTVTLDPTRGPLIRRIRVQDQTHHHRRLIRRAPVPVRAISRIKRPQIEPATASITNHAK